MKEKLEEILKEYDSMSRNNSSLVKCLEEVEKVLYDNNICSDDDKIIRIEELIQDFQVPF